MASSSYIPASSLVSPSRKRTRETSYHPYANTNGISSGITSSKNSNGNGSDGSSNLCISSDHTNGQSDGSRVQYMVSNIIFLYTSMSSTT